MHIVEEGKWLKLSKISYQKNWYQIYANSSGVRTFLKLEKLETYPNLKSFLTLDKIFNYQNNGIYYDADRTKQLLKNYFKFTLNLNVFNVAYKICKNYKLIKNNNINYEIKMESNKKSKTLISTEEIKEYLDDVYDIEEIIDNNDNIKNEYKEIIKKYVLQHNKEDLKILAYNLKNIKIVDTKLNSYFDKFSYEIGINDKKEETLFHELRHASKFTSYDDIYTILHNDFLKMNYKNTLGIAVLEGINSKYTCQKYEETIWIDLILMLIKEEELLDSENKNIDTLIELLSKYNNKEKIIKMLLMMDEYLICKNNNIPYHLDSKVMIYSILMECYLNKIDELLNNMNPKNIVYNLKHYSTLVEKWMDNINIEHPLLKEKLEEEYTMWYHSFVNKKLLQLDFKNYNIINEHEDIKDFIFIERQIYHENYIINDENFITKRVKHQHGNNEVYIYDIYIKKEYLKNTTKEELLEYVSLEGLNKAILSLEV